MVLRPSRRCRPADPGERGCKAADHQRTGWWRRVWAPWRRHRALDGRIPGKFVYPSVEHGKEDPESRGTFAVVADGFSFPKKNAARNPGLLQPQRVIVERGPAEAGFLCAAEILSGHGSARIAAALINPACDPETPHARPSEWPPT